MPQVLIIEDDKDIAELISIHLNDLVCQIKHCTNGEAGLAMAIGESFDLIILDITLPGMDGLEVCRKLREQPWGNDIVIVALTGWGQEEDRQKSRDAGFNGHLVKPVELTALTKLLTESSIATV